MLKKRNNMNSYRHEFKFVQNNLTYFLITIKLTFHVDKIFYETSYTLLDYKMKNHARVINFKGN